MRMLSTVVLIMFLMIMPMIYPEGNITNTTQDNVVFEPVAYNTTTSPWANNSKICIFMREWIQKGMFLVIWLVFLMGIATISGAAFPAWRNYGSKMILGSIGAMILYILGMQALKFFMGTNICNLGAF